MILVILLLTFVGVCVLFFMYNPTNLSTGNVVLDFVYSNSSGPRWASFPVSYYFTNEKICGEYEIKRIRNAFSIIENETNGKIFFTETNGFGNINIICSRDFARSDEKEYFIAAEGGYSSLGDTITGGEVELKNMRGGRASGSCINFPSVELHEIFHVFAVPHSDNPHSLMYPYSNSKQCLLAHIDNETIDILNNIYNFK